MTSSERLDYLSGIRFLSSRFLEEVIEEVSEPYLSTGWPAQASQLTPVR